MEPGQGDRDAVIGAIGLMGGQGLVQFPGPLEEGFGFERTAGRPEPFRQVEHREGQLLAENWVLGCVGCQSVVELEGAAEGELGFRFPFGLLRQEMTQGQERPGQLLTVHGDGRVALNQGLVPFHGVAVGLLRLSQLASLGQQDPEVASAPASIFTPRFPPIAPASSTALR